MESHVVDELAEELLDVLLVDSALDIAFEMHRRLKTGGLSLHDIFDASWANKADSAMDELQSSNDAEVLRKSAPREPKGDFFCPHCGGKVSVLRFAPHLDKCLMQARRMLLFPYACQWLAP